MATNPTSLNTPYLFLTGAVIIAVVFLFVVLQPMMDGASALRHTIAEDTQKLRDKESFLDSLDVKIQQLQALPGVEGQLATILPATDRTQDIVRVLNEYASQSGIVIRSVTNNSASSTAATNADRARGDALTVPSGVRVLSFEVNVAGSYEQVRLFLTLLGRSPRVIDVEGLSLQQVTGQTGQITGTVTIQVYSQEVAQGS